MLKKILIMALLIVAIFGPCLAEEDIGIMMLEELDGPNDVTLLSHTYGRYLELLMPLDLKYSVRLTKINDCFRSMVGLDFSEPFKQDEEVYAIITNGTHGFLRCGVVSYDGSVWFDVASIQWDVLNFYIFSASE